MRGLVPGRSAVDVRSPTGRNWVGTYLGVVFVQQFRGRLTRIAVRGEDGEVRRVRAEDVRSFGATEFAELG